MRIGVFDSGIGGLSTLLACARYLPQAEYIYLADTAYAPYGDREAEEIRARSELAYEQFRQWGVDALVIACNTATSAAAGPLREFAQMPIIGIEPAISKALCHGSARILLLATELTVRGEKLRQLLHSRDPLGRVLPLACPGWMDIIESQAPGWQELAKKYWQDRIAPNVSGMGSIVLGCTHYCWLDEEIGQWSGGMPVFDGNEGVARQVFRLLLGAEPPPIPDPLPASLQVSLLFTSNPQERRQAAMRMLGQKGVVVVAEYQHRDLRPQRL